MKKYIAPEIEFTKFNCKDIIQTSGEQPTKLTNGGVSNFSGPADSTIFD